MFSKEYLGMRDPTCARMVLDHDNGDILAKKTRNTQGERMHKHNYTRNLTEFKIHV